MEDEDAIGDIEIEQSPYCRKVKRDGSVRGKLTLTAID